MSRDPLFFLVVTALLLVPAALLLAGAAMLAAPASGAPRGSLRCAAAFHGEHTGDLPIPQNVGARSDTLWFGGDDGNGIAMYGGAPNEPIYWDFETPGSNAFQGWTSVDETDNPGIYFGRVTAQDFIDHEDPCIPMFEHTPGEPTIGEIWCGIHEDEANERDFGAGMGYQNNMCQRAFSPEFSIDPDNDDIDIEFTYFNHSERNFDYSYIDILCYDSHHDLIDSYEIKRISGIKGDYTAPVLFDEDVEVPAGTLDPSTVNVQLELFFEADRLWADEDGLWDSPCGPIAADNITIEVGSSSGYYDFEIDEQGWTFDRCVPIGKFMHIVEAATYELWLEAAGLTCDCPLSGDALTVVDEENSPYDPPGMAPGQQERLISGTVPRYGFEPPAWNTCIVEYDMFVDFAANTGLYWVEGYKYYPCITPMNPVPHWSKRYGKDLWGWTSNPYCGLIRHNYMTLDDTQGTMMPVEWDSMKAIFDVAAACDIFGVPTSVCINEGQSNGSPVFDNIRVGLTNSPDAPPIRLITAGQFHDGFGQNYPTYLEPSDRGNSNISYNLSRDPEDNDWHGDTTAVVGPRVTTEESRWLAKMCFRVAKKGPRQNCIPEYQEWKARLSADPEEGWVCALMDSVQIVMGVQDDEFASYFHEDDPGFNPSFPDYSESQEILPDLTFVPGTRIEYYFASYWYNGGVAPDEYYFLPDRAAAHEFEILPMMELKPNEEYTVQWASVLYVDAYNRGAEPCINALLEELELAYDRFDYLDASSCFHASLKRDFGGETHNPGGYGNNGCTTEQLLGYRLILLNTGRFGVGVMAAEDFEMFEEWLLTTECGLQDTRRAIIFNGSSIAEIMNNPDPDWAGVGLFARTVLGVTLVDGSYGEYNNDEAYCVYLEPAGDSMFVPADPGISLYGNGCPHQFDYDVLGVHPGVEGVVGNLLYYSYQGSGTEPYVEFAQVVRENVEPGVANWKTVVDGFSLPRLSERGCHGEDCSKDSACIMDGALDLLIPQLEWLTDPGDPFEPWRYPCESTGVDEEEEGETHLSGPVDYLFPSRPNPFSSRAAVRFNLAHAGHVRISIYDLTGREVKALVDAELDAGEHTQVWDGLDDRGHRVSAGVFWTQMRTQEGYLSSKRLLLLR